MRFTKNNDGTVTDANTGLTWSQTIATYVNRSDADDAVKGLGQGWRLPTLTELFGLVDHEKHTPAVDADVFQDTADDWYRTGTPCAWDDTCDWLVHFGCGRVSIGRRHNSACVRAVKEAA